MQLTVYRCVYQSQLTLHQSEQTVIPCCRRLSPGCHWRRVQPEIQGHPEAGLGPLLHCVAVLGQTVGGTICYMTTCGYGLCMCSVSYQCIVVLVTWSTRIQGREVCGIEDSEVSQALH